MFETEFAAGLIASTLRASAPQWFVWKNYDLKYIIAGLSAEKNSMPRLYSRFYRVWINAELFV